MIKYIVTARRWFAKTYGNTYHTVTITDAKTNECIYDSPITYGYDEQYRHTALDWLVKHGFYFESIHFNHDLLRKECYFNVTDVARKKDL